jgi:integrase
LLHVLGKGAKAADIPLPIPVLRAVREAVDVSSHRLRRTFCTTGLVAGISIRDMQYAMRPADPRTTMRYDMPRPISTATPPTPSPPTSPG